MIWASSWSSASFRPRCRGARPSTSRQPAQAREGGGFSSGGNSAQSGKENHSDQKKRLFGPRSRWRFAAPRWELSAISSFGSVKTTLPTQRELFQLAPELLGWGAIGCCVRSLCFRTKVAFFASKCKHYIHSYSLQASVWLTNTQPGTSSLQYAQRQCEERQTDRQTDSHDQDFHLDESQEIPARGKRPRRFPRKPLVRLSALHSSCLEVESATALQIYVQSPTPSLETSQLR